MIEIYAPSNELEGERIVSFLQSEGIEAQLQATQNLPQMPTGTEFTIFAPTQMRQKAIELIANARLDKVITDTGMFL
ncbi:MAG: hypothetical protein WCK49_07785 [Myxococcaceae bacterium]